jgi:bacteriorhodopsin
MTARIAWTKIAAAVLGFLAPALALAQAAQPIPDAGPVHGTTPMSTWVWVVVALAIIAAALWAFRARGSGPGGTRFGPHGPRAPTPRGP